MPERTVTIASSVGLHARPASLFSQAAGKSGAKVTLTSPAGKTVNAASILGVLSVGSEFGWGTWKTLLTQRPGRLTVFGAKLVALAVGQATQLLPHAR